MLSSLTFRWIVQIILSILNIVGILFFFRGFFPSKVVLPGHNEFPDTSPFLINNQPQFSKFILMVVDAMRSDFCYSDTHSHFHFLHELINQGYAIPFTAFSNPPTVTLPRLKGITTGGTPNFLDAIINVNDDKSDTSQGLNNQDSWVYQFLNNNKTIHFFGDDTWLRLFPEQFSEYEGTNSFFVSDFTEVDNNVTRHLDVQLNSNNWDGLILHYLGLDHIGHKGGPESVYMKAKHEEMDRILKRLYQYAETQDDVVIVLMGDHGMNEIGNHGGSSIGETSAALTFISPKFNQSGLKAPVSGVSDFSYYNKISQIDLVPSLSILLNIPIPKNSLGIIAKPILELWPEESRLPVLLENCNQIMQLYLAKNYDDNSVIDRWNKLKSGNVSIEDVYDFLGDIQLEMAVSATNYAYSDLFSGIGIVFGVAIISIILFNVYFAKSGNNDIRLTLFFQLFVIIYSVHFHGSSLIEEEHQLWYFFTTISLVFVGVLFFKSKNLPYLTLMLIGIRIIRSWNNNGQKYSSKFNIGYYLLNQNNSLLWLLIILTYFVLTLSTYAQGSFVQTFTLSNTNQGVQDVGNLMAFTSLFVTTSMSFSFKMVQFYLDGNKLPWGIHAIFLWAVQSYGVTLSELNDHDVKIKLSEICVSLSRLTLGGICVVLLLRLIVGKLRGVKWGTITDITNLLTIYLIHQTRCENIPIFTVLILVKFAWSKFTVNILQNKKTLNIDQDILITTLFTICLQNLTFFSMGNTNSLATVDLSNAYNGIKAYDIIPVGILTFISNFSGPVFWSLSSLQILFEPSKLTWDMRTPISKEQVVDLVFFPKLKKMVLWVKTLITLLFYSIAGVNLLGSCLNLRFHLFIWSVFSPKLLYFGSWVVFVNFLIDLILAGIVLIVV